MGVWKGAKSSDKVVKLATLCAYLLLTSLSVWLQQHTHQTYTHVQEYLDHGQSEGGVRPSLSLIDLDHDMGLMCICCWTTGRLLFYFLERLVAQLDLRVFFSRTIEKLGLTCDQIGHTLEPCQDYLYSAF